MSRFVFECCRWRKSKESAHRMKRHQILEMRVVGVTKRVEVVRRQPHPPFLLLLLGVQEDQMARVLEARKDPKVHAGLPVPVTKVNNLMATVTDTIVTQPVSVKLRPHLQAHRMTHQQGTVKNPFKLFLNSIFYNHCWCNHFIKLYETTIL